MVKKTLCQRCCEGIPGDGFFGQKSEVGIPTSVEESRPRCGAGSAGWRLLCLARQECGALGIEASTLGEPSNKVGRASTKGRWASQYYPYVLRLSKVPARTQRTSLSQWPPLAQRPATFTVAHNACACLALLQVPARHCACSARSVPAQHWHSYGARLP